MEVLEDFFFSDKRSGFSETTSLGLNCIQYFSLQSQYNQIIRNSSIKYA